MNTSRSSKQTKKNFREEVKTLFLVGSCGIGIVALIIGSITSFYSSWITLVDEGTCSNFNYIDGSVPINPEYACLSKAKTDLCFSFSSEKLQSEMCINLFSVVNLGYECPDCFEFITLFNATTSHPCYWISNTRVVFCPELLARAKSSFTFSLILLSAVFPLSFLTCLAITCWERYVSFKAKKKEEIVLLGNTSSS